jgi:hypothetical protein
MLNAKIEGRIETARISIKEGKKKFRFSRPSLAALAEEALKKAVARAIEDHRRTGDPIAVLRNGKAVSIAADQIRVSEPEVEYDIRSKKATKPRNTQTKRKKQRLQIED